MKHHSRFSSLAGRFAVLTAVALSLAALPAFAQHGGLNPHNSFAGLFVGSGENPHALNLGVSPVDGDVNLDPDYPDASVFNFSMSSDNTSLIFKSKQASWLRDNLWQVTGDLTVERTERSIQANAAEDYSGPVYGEPEIHSSTREVTFVLAMLNDPAIFDHAEILGSATIGRENFPELLAGISRDNWPSLTGNYDCSIDMVGEDYAGASCEGQYLETKANFGSYPGSGEDYAGIESTIPGVNQMTIVLRLSMADALIARAGN